MVREEPNGDSEANQLMFRHSVSESLFCGGTTNSVAPRVQKRYLILKLYGGAMQFQANFKESLISRNFCMFCR